MAVPNVIPESKVNVFKFYDNHAVHEAILFQGRILRLAGIFHSNKKSEAFNFAYTLCQEFFTLITPSSSVYRVWVDIRCRDTFNLSFPLPSAPTTAQAASNSTNLTSPTPNQVVSFDHDATVDAPYAQSSNSALGQIRHLQAQVG